jgi:hypothetical protein
MFKLCALFLRSFGFAFRNDVQGFISMGISHSGSFSLGFVFRTSPFGISNELQCSFVNLWG